MASAKDFVRFFKEADTDNSDALSPDELCKAMRKAGFPGSDSEIKKMFKSSDTSGDGLITLDEFLEAMGAQPPNVKKAAVSNRLFAEWDTDCSGYLCRDEVKAIFKEIGHDLNEKEMERAMAMLDHDRNDRVSLEEFQKYWKSV